MFKRERETRETIELFRVFRVLSISLLFVLAVTVHADELYLKDGRIIQAEEVWQVGETVWYRQGKIIASIPANDVVRIAKPKVAATTAANPAPSTTPLETRKISRIIMKDGTQIDADAVWEDAERIGYRLGKMQTFIELTEVKSVVRDLSIGEQKPATDLQLRFTTGHRGLDQLISYSAGKYQIDPLLIYLVMREESGFNHRAVSRAGARGLMQLMPGTAQRLGVRNIHDPVENVDAGSRYLRSLLEMFDGDVNLALAAYNAGEDAVLRYGRRIPPYRETRNYVLRINTAYRRAIDGLPVEERQK